MSGLCPPPLPPPSACCAPPICPPKSDLAAPLSLACFSPQGWFGGEGGAERPLTKFYGPDRDKFLPGGLYSNDDVPEYMDGTLPGE